MVQPCTFDYEITSQRYDLYAISISIITALQFALLAHSTHKELRILCRKESERHISASITMRISYILLQCTALTWDVLLILNIDPHFDRVDNPSFCAFTAWSMYFPGPILYGIYLYSILFRLEASFKSSFLELWKCTIYILRSLVILPPLCYIVSMIFDDHNLYCSMRWDPADTNNSNYSTSFCSAPAPSLIIFKYHVAEMWVISVNALNLIFGIIFSLKLRTFTRQCKLANANDPYGSKHFKFEALIIKNNILTVCGILSTFSAYTLWAIFTKVQIMLLDALVNSVTIGLMFQSNSRYYKRLCRPCIWICLVRCKCRNRKSMNRNRKKKFVRSKSK